MADILRRRVMLKEAAGASGDWDYEWTYDKGTLESCGFTPNNNGNTNNTFTYNENGYVYVRTTTSASTAGYIQLPSAVVGDNKDYIIEVDASVEGNPQSRDPSGIGFVYGKTSSSGYIQIRALAQSGSNFITRYTDGSWHNVTTPTFSKDTRYVFRTVFIHDGNTTFSADGTVVLDTSNKNAGAGATNRLNFFTYGTYNRLRVYRISIKVL